MDLERLDRQPPDRATSRTATCSATARTTPGALADLAKLTGPAPLLPESTFGTWFSQYYPYSTADYQGTILPQFEANGVSLDNLSVDTDWKSPSTWDGWEWSPCLFPDPTAFEDWAASQDIHVALNVHPSIANDDPLYAQAQDVAGNTAQRQRHPGGVGLGQRGPGRVLLRHRRPDAERCRR